MSMILPDDGKCVICGMGASIAIHWVTDSVEAHPFTTARRAFELVRQEQERERKAGVTA